MSVYDLRYCVSVDGQSYYTNSAEEVLSIVDAAPGGAEVWVTEGYGDYRDTDNPEVTMVLRVTTGLVLVSTLRYQVERAKVEAMLR